MNTVQLCADPTVRTLRNGKRRYINQNFESDLISDIGLDVCGANGASSIAGTTTAGQLNSTGSNSGATPTPSQNGLEATSASKSESQTSADTDKEAGEDKEDERTDKSSKSKSAKSESVCSTSSVSLKNITEYCETILDV